MDKEWLPKERIEEYDFNKYDFEWNEDYTMFRPIRLKWWCDFSYMLYQSSDIEGNHDES